MENTSVMDVTTKSEMISMSKARCSNCMFYEYHDLQVGTCRINPPTVLVMPIQQLNGVSFSPITAFPTVQKNEWCARFQDRVEE